MSIDAEQLLRALTDASVQQERKKFCHESASALQACGDVLWAFGLAEEPLRRAAAIVLQIAGRLAEGARTMLETENWYAKGPLVRQLIETEYLLFRFASDPAEADKWLSSSPREIRNFFGPGAMRKRSDPQFRFEEYAAHSQRGGHPNPRAAFLLPEHALVAEMVPFGSVNWLWVDLAQHLARVCTRMSSLVKGSSFAHVGMARQSIERAEAALKSWESNDLWATVYISPPASDQEPEK